jgi:predicted ATPase
LSVIGQWPLVGRSEELAVIADAARAADDSARGIVLSGSAGVGKTRLAMEAVAGCGTRDARRRWITATASARSVPLGAFADIASDFGPDPLGRVREVIDGLIGDQGGEVIVGVDDAHLLDELSAFTVHQLVTRRLATVILTIRSGESPPDAITAIWKDHHLERLELQPLSLVETTQLVEHVLAGPVHSLSARRLWQFTQGNALYLRHLVESEVDAGRITRLAGVWLWNGRPELSPTLAELLETRIALAPKAVRDVLDALAMAEPLETDILAAPHGCRHARQGRITRPDKRRCQRASRVRAAGTSITRRGPPRPFRATATTTWAHRHRTGPKRLNRSPRPGS